MNSRIIICRPFGAVFILVKGGMFMAYVTTDATYYSTKATSVDIYANCVPYNTSSISYAKVSLVHKSTGNTIVLNTVVGLTGYTDFRNSLDIYSSDPRGTYYVYVVWYTSSGSIVCTARSSDIYLTS
jgi:hypothetical protein